VPGSAVAAGGRGGCCGAVAAGCGLASGGAGCTGVSACRGNAAAGAGGRGADGTRIGIGLVTAASRRASCGGCGLEGVGCGAVGTGVTGLGAAPLPAATDRSAPNVRLCCWSGACGAVGDEGEVVAGATRTAAG
jgi:hypothetical protein